MESSLGIIGGMGPEATVQFMQYVIEETPADNDQEHIRMTVLNDPTIPDRNTAIIENGEDPRPQLKKRANELEAMGVSLIAVPCNTFHYFHKDVNESVDIDVIHMIEETGVALNKRSVETVGLLASEATICRQIYHSTLSEHNICVKVPENIDPTMDAIYDVKSGKKENAARKVTQEAEKLLDQGADMVVLGCTELPLVTPDTDVFFNPAKIMAQECVRRLTE